MSKERSYLNDWPLLFCVAKQISIINICLKFRVGFRTENAFKFYSVH